MLFQDAGTYKRERVILGKQSVEISVQHSEKKMLNFCANNYLGLSSHPDVIEAAKNAVESHGAGMSSVRFICGTQDIHRQLELKIAEFHGRQDSILYAACFDANGGLFDALTSTQFHSLFSKAWNIQQTNFNLSSSRAADSYLFKKCR